MKEVLTKKFWRDVKKTFDDAREGVPPNAGELKPASATKAEGGAGDGRKAGESQPERPASDGKGGEG